MGIAGALAGSPGGGPEGTKASAVRLIYSPVSARPAFFFFFFLFFFFFFLGGASSPSGLAAVASVCAFGCTFSFEVGALVAGSSTSGLVSAGCFCSCWALWLYKA